MNKTRELLKLAAVSACVGACILWGEIPAAAGAQRPTEQEERSYAQSGVTMMMDGDLDGAIAVFQQIEQRDPDSPLGFVLEADAVWWKIYIMSANLIDPDVFDVANMEATPYDSHFDDLNEVAIKKAEARIKNNQDLARSYLYEGFAHALRARLEGLHDRDMATARAGKKMRSQLMKAQELDASLADADLGLGIYNYFVDTLPGIVKVLSVFIMLPGGSREEGLRQLQECAEKGDLVKGEAAFYLAKDYSRGSEKQFAKSAHYFAELQKQYPHNPLWPMLLGSIDYRLGDSRKGEELYREVYKSTAGKNSEYAKSVHRAAAQALQRQHSEEKFQ